MKAKKLVASLVMSSMIAGSAFALETDASVTTAAQISTVYQVKSGETLWSISKKQGVSVDSIKKWNRLPSDKIVTGQKLTIYKPSTSVKGARAVLSWPSKTYIVKSGDTFSSIARKYGTTVSALLKYNYMSSSSNWLNAGQKIAINGYAPRNFSVIPGESASPARVGKLVDWFKDGQYILTKNKVFTIVDKRTGKQFKVKMMGGYNHSDVEPVAKSDTDAMKSLFGGKWTWSPRPVVIYVDGMNIAGSLSGMPHSFDTVSANGVAGHYDLYLANSKPHKEGASTSYVQQHERAVQEAAK